jgi:hypothetical protein
MGSNKGEQPTLSKESIRPTLMVRASPPSIPPPSAAEYAAHPHAYPLVEGSERGVVAVFEILVPAPQSPVHGDDDRVEAVPVRAPGLDPYHVFELS